MQYMIFMQKNAQSVHLWRPHWYVNRNKSVQAFFKKKLKYQKINMRDWRIRHISESLL